MNFLNNIHIVKKNNQNVSFLMFLCLFLFSHFIFPQTDSTFIKYKKQIDSLVKIKVDSIVSNQKKTTKTDTKISIFQYRLVGDGLTMQGNINRILLSARAELGLNTKKIQFETNPRFTFGEQNTNLAERDFFIDMNASVYHQKKIYAFALGAYEFSNLRGILERILAGGGIGWHIIRKNNTQISISNALFFETTDFVRRTDFKTWRNSTRMKIKYSFWNNRLNFLHYIFYQPSLQDASNVRWNFNMIIEMPIYNGLNFRISVDNFYESFVVDNRKNNDLTTRFGFSWGNKRGR
ncbi:MAG: DUF481 domain-containing protein [Bacteroidetes bacterium]|nr:MAG: DUF481 domain-containing protein [Bacteroidota bacterium]TAG86599.1 MAG: DUF481 domain-containing protein [Bacteroidota bacterium]